MDKDSLYCMYLAPNIDLETRSELAESLYPCSQVKDRAQVRTADFERQCVSPVGLQSEIDKLVAQFPKGRSFVRYVYCLQVSCHIKQLSPS